MVDKKIVDKIKAEFPSGHPDFVDMTMDELDLHNKKNYDYAHGGDPLGNFNRVSTICSLYNGLDLSNPAVVAFVYALKQIDASLWMLCQGYEGNVEGMDERLRDIHTYIKLVRILCKRSGNGETSQE